MADVFDNIKLVAPDAEVACLCDAPEPTIGNLKNLMEARSDALRVAGTVFLLVDGSKVCFRGLVRLLQSTSSATIVIPVLMEEFSVANRVALCEKIATLVQNGADDVVVLPATLADLHMTIAVSLAKGTVHRRVASNLEGKLRNATKQADELFWQSAHKILPDFPAEQTNMIEIPRQRVGNFVLVEKLGEGGFGEVHKCQNMETGVCWAVKVLPKRNIKSICQLQQIAMEYSVLRRVNHPNVVSGSDFLHGVKNLYLIMELAGSTTLEKTIRAEGERGLPWARAQKLLFQIASGVARLHEGIAHCDLKPENITISKDGCAKIVDFGQAVDITLEVPVLKRPRGTMPFIAPEVMILSPHWDPTSCDLWQVGVILFEVLCGIGSFEDLMVWAGIDFHSLSQLRVCEEELQVRFAETAKVKTLAVVRSKCDVATPAFATQLLADMLQLQPAARLPASSMVSRLIF
jgi:hypothetical protein